MENIDGIDPERLVFLDEAGSNLGMTPRYARSISGTRAFAKRPRNQGNNISMIGAIRLRGFQAFNMCHGAVSGPKFLSFLEQDLVSKLGPGDVVIMDNCRTHHIAPVKQIIEQTGARVVYLPPYHPELNPIEEAWSKFKHLLRKAQARTVSALLEAAVAAKSAITVDDIAGYFRHAGYEVAHS